METQSGRSRFLELFRREKPGGLAINEVDRLEHSFDAIRKAGACPVCSELSQHDDRYFFWLLNESYQELSVQEGMSRSLGFCPRHARRLLTQTSFDSAIAHLHRFALRDILRRLSASDLSGDTATWIQAMALPSTGCPACEARAATAGRTIGFFVRSLDDPLRAEGYGPAGILCFPHFTEAIARLPSDLVEPLLRSHAARLEADREAAASLLVSDEHGLDAYPPLTSVGSASEFLVDPVGDFAAKLGRRDSCAVCAVTSEAWTQWMNWLDSRARNGATRSDLWDLLPTCSLHVWTTFKCASAELSSLVAANSLRMARERVQIALRCFPGATDDSAEEAESPLVMQFRSKRERSRVAVEIVNRESFCPVCRRMETACDRAIELLFALLHEDRYQRLFEEGHGLCLKHFKRACSLASSDEVTRLFIAAQRAKLELLNWELEEYVRKMSWGTRPEPPGTEQSAPARVVHRFSGTGLA